MKIPVIEVMEDHVKHNGTEFKGNVSKFSQYLRFGLRDIEGNGLRL